MTVSSTATRVAYTGNGLTTAFAFSWRFLATSEIKVYVGGVLQTTGYSVSAPGISGTVTFNSAPANGASVVITRSTALTQNIDYVANDPFAADVTEGGFDRAMLAAQDNAAAIKRCFRMPDWYAPIDPVTALSDVVTSVTAFGAVGDGTTDDTAAIAAAVLGGGKIYFPPGTYIMTSAVIVPSNTDIYGAGETSIIKTAALTYDTTIGHAMFAATGKSKISFFGLRFDASAMSSFSDGMRCLYFSGCSEYSVRNCSFKTPGAAVASIGCAQFQITGNRVEISSLDGVAKHDGIIDQWGGCADFVIDGNILKCGNIGDHPILVTGEDTAGNPTANLRFTISNNIIHNSRQNGVWIQGRDGGNTQFVVTGNVIDTVTQFHGIHVSDSDHGIVSGNTVKNIAYTAIRLAIESGGGGDGGDSNVISNNLIIDCNQLGSADDLVGCAVAVLSGCTGNLVIGNRVVGSAQRNSVYFASGSSGNVEHGGLYDTGVYAAPTSDPARTNTITEYLYKQGLILANSAAQITSANSTSEQTLATVTIATNLMGANGRLRFRIAGTMSGSGNKVFRVRLGGIGGTVVSTQTYTTATSFTVTGVIQNRNSTSSQRAESEGTRATDAVFTAYAAATAAIDTSVQTTLVVTCEKATGSETFTIESYCVELLP